MNILMILEGEYPEDIRVKKEVKSLVAGGHHVVVFCNNAMDRQEYEIYGLLEIYRNKDLLPFSTMMSGFVNEHVIWRGKIRRLVREHKIDVVHCHDLPTVKIGIELARSMGIKVVADLHENFPESVAIARELDTHMSTKEKVYFRMTRPYSIEMYKRIESNWTKKCDHVITVVDEARKHYIDDCGVDRDKVTVVSNTVDYDGFLSYEVDKCIVSQYVNEYNLFYAGYIAPHKGADILIRAVAELAQEMDDIGLILVGRGEGGYIYYLEALAEQLGVVDRVKWVPWVELNMLPSYIEASQICLVPHIKSGHTDTTIPHKLFQYMFMGKPVIVTDCDPLARIVTECGCGMVAHQDYVAHISQYVKQLREYPLMVEGMGISGLRAVRDKYNWENDGKKLLEVYEQIGR